MSDSHVHISCDRRIQFCAGHRVMGHESKCAHFHGHNYVIWFEARPVAGKLDGIGRVVDFSVLKERIGGWIERMWDHGFIAHTADNIVTIALEGRLIGYNDGRQEQLKLYRMPYNPTAENMARYLLTEICPKLLDNTGAEVTSVEVWETENCRGRATLASVCAD